MKHMPSLPSFPRGKRSLRKLLDFCRADQNQNQNRASPSAVSPSPECRRAQKQASGTDQNDLGRSRRTPSTQAHGAKTVSIEQPAHLPHAAVLQARQELDSVLGRLGDLLEDAPREVLCDESLSLSISLYVDDIRQKSKTLDTVLSAKHMSTLKRSEEDINSLPALDNTSVEQPRSSSISRLLPTPDFDGSFNIDLRQFSTRDESPYRLQCPGRNAARSLAPLAHQRHSGSPASRPLAASTPLSVAPLQLPRRSTSPSSFGSRSRASPSSSSSSTSPFCREIHALDAHIHASRREGRRSSPSSTGSKPPPCHLRTRTLDLGQGRLLLDAPGCPAPRPLVRRQVSLDDHRALLQRYECTGHRRQFSTEGKAQRLRSLRGAPSSPQLLLRHDDARAGSGQDAAEPLSMDELMGFLREGNSLREL